MAEDDLPLLHDWLGRLHVGRRWWDTDTYEQAVSHYGPALRGEEPTDHYVIVVDGRDVGMIQTYLAADYPEFGAFVDDPEVAAGVDLLIGDEALIGLGLGPRVLSAFVREVVRAPSCAATVEPGNRSSWRAFEKAGFRHAATSRRTGGRSGSCDSTAASDEAVAGEPRAREALVGKSRQTRRRLADIVGHEGGGTRDPTLGGGAACGRSARSMSFEAGLSGAVGALRLPDYGGRGGTRSRQYHRRRWIRAGSATSRSSRTSITGSRRSPTASSS
jgi:aminoglycoside 6'-N-acetyltransferase